RVDLPCPVRDIDRVGVRVPAPEVPVPKCPDPGATLPVILPNGNPRRTQVLWDQVRTHADIAATGDVYHDRYLEDDLVSADEFGADLAVDEIPVEPAPAPAPGLAPHRHEPANGG